MQDFFVVFTSSPTNVIYAAKNNNNDGLSNFESNVDKLRKMGCAINIWGFLFLWRHIIPINFSKLQR